MQSLSGARSIKYLNLASAHQYTTSRHWSHMKATENTKNEMAQKLCNLKHKIKTGKSEICKYVQGIVEMHKCMKHTGGRTKRVRQTRIALLCQMCRIVMRMYGARLSSFNDATHSRTTICTRRERDSSLQLMASCSQCKALDVDGSREGETHRRRDRHRDGVEKRERGIRAMHQHEWNYFAKRMKIHGKVPYALWNSFYIPLHAWHCWHRLKRKCTRLTFFQLSRSEYAGTKLPLKIRSR